MKRNRLTEMQIIAILKEHEVGVKIGDLARTLGISEATLHSWMTKCGGRDLSDSTSVVADGAGWKE